MAVVITVAQQKGGSGKTMLAANLAAWFASGKSTALLDIDPQHSLVHWHRLRVGHDPAPAPVTLSDVSGWRLAGELDRLRREHELVLIDTPARHRQRCPPGDPRGRPGRGADAAERARSVGRGRHVEDRA